MPSAPHGTSSPQRAPRARLDSWKEIADYLNKGERTAKRWESERSLPVHHVPGGGHGSVYAFTAELEEWLLCRQPREGDLSREPASPSNGGASIPLRQAPTESIPESSNGSASPPEKWSRRFWRIAAYILPTAAVVVVATHFVNLHATQVYPSFLRFLLAPTKSGSQSSASDPEKLLAHELYLRGRFEWNRRTPDSLDRALDYFTQAVVHDPGNAQAYVGLADTYNLLREYTLMPENEAYERAIAAAKKAIELDDSLAEAHRSLAFDEVWGNWDFAAGQREFQRAIELNPRDPVTHLWFANAFSSPGWYSICLREIDRAQELDPASHAILADKGLMLFHAGKTKPGLDLVKQVELTDPEFLSPHRYLASMYMTLRDYPDFFTESEEAAELSGDQILKQTTIAAKAGFQRDGERGLFHALYQSQRKFYSEGKLAGTFLAMTCARMGRKEEAIQLLREEYGKHSPKFLMLRDNADLITLKDEPGYQELLSKVHSPMPATTADTDTESTFPGFDSRSSSTQDAKHTD
jgi:tetratricopeptide (TPR) repeat protein